MARAVKKWFVAAGLCAGLACASRNSEGGGATLARVSAFEERAAHDDDRLDTAERNAAALTRDVQQLAVLYEDVERELRRTEAAYRAASRHYDDASTDFARASEAYADAERKWRVVTTTIMVAAASDMAGKWLCDGRMSRAQIRKMWKRQGHDLKGIDADHIWPKSRRGMDHPWNFQRMESSLNRSLGNDIWWKLQNQPLDLLRGFAVSSLMQLQCG